MEQRLPWEVNSTSASPEIPSILWNPKDRHCVYKRPPLFPFLSQLNPVHAYAPYSFKVHFSITLLFTSKSSKWLISVQLKSKLRILNVVILLFLKICELNA